MTPVCGDVEEERGLVCTLPAGHFEEHQSDPYPIPGWVGDGRHLVKRAFWPLAVKPKRTRRRRSS